MQDDRSFLDHVLSTTRSIRWRMDLDRQVERETLVECIRLATFAPNASNAQDWRWIVIDAPEVKRFVAERYRAGMMETMHALLAERERNGDEAGVRHSRATIHLGEVLERVPIHVIPCMRGRIEEDPSLGNVTRLLGSIYPAVWSFQLALRSRGLGSTLTTSHLLAEREVGERLGVPSDYTQVALIPVAYIKGGELSPPPRRPVEEVIGWNGW
ncbi:MAG: nitroreductase family protein [Deltaproteobacteria bacterium]|jgi:nitroreductase|nr:nitroreductase family protein [Deltaproteobacteria bacterium]